MRVGTAIHSVRAVPREALGIVGQARGYGLVHLHLSEQPAENEACRAYYGCSPTELISEEGLVDITGTTAVHATHLSENDRGLLRTGVTVCMCPTTERDLADGIGPARSLSAERGEQPWPALSLGSDQHAVIDMFEEARGMELDERLATLRRGQFTQAELLAAMTAHETIGWPDAGRLEVGARADLVAVELDSVRTAGCDPAQVIMAATAADVHTVICDGVEIVSEGQHRLGDVGGMLARSIRQVTN
jgi:cytosine/adenosine deaminase-related metal-dependent hydrolase